MARRKRTAKIAGQEEMFQARVTTAPWVPAIREAVTQWRTENYPGVTDTTRILLRHWFDAEHRLPGGREFRYYPAQREAIETLIWLYEVESVRKHRDLVERFASTPGLRLLQYDEFALYAVKMATGAARRR